MELRTTAMMCRDHLSCLRQPKRLSLRVAVASTSSPWANPLHPPAAPFPSPGPSHLRRQPAQSQRPPAHRRPYATETSPRRGPTAPPTDLDAIHGRVQELTDSVLKLSPASVPSEQRTLYVLEQLESLASLVLDERGPDGILKQKKNTFHAQQQTATSALLGSVDARQNSGLITKASILGAVSGKAEEIALHPHVFLTPAILKAYVELQGLLRQPASFPHVFTLYAGKSVPRAKATGVELSPVSPDKINAAIDSKTANMALTAAIKAHNLTLAIDIITTSFSTPAFRKSKVLRRAAFPMAGLAIAPFGAYALSNSFSAFQQTMDAGTATGVAFAGIMTYVGAVGMVGYVAVTTANDQMDRVTWASGVPLWERWTREEERAAVDRVAGAWGFKDVEKRGEEEGVDWENLREWVGVRGMVLDRVSLMEGME